MISFDYGNQLGLCFFRKTGNSLIHVIVHHEMQRKIKTTEQSFDARLFRPLLLFRIKPCFDHVQKQHFRPELGGPSPPVVVSPTNLARHRNQAPVRSWSTVAGVRERVLPVPGASSGKSDQRSDSLPPLPVNDEHRRCLPRGSRREFLRPGDQWPPLRFLPLSGNRW